MRHGCLFLFLSLLLATACTRQAEPVALLNHLYEEYLPLSCPPPGEYPDVNKYGQVLIRYMTPQLYDDWMKSQDSERDSWIDYDIFVQGQDCWPGIRAESINRIGKSQWYEVVVGLPDYDNPDSIVKRSSVFFHLTLMDEAWLIDAIDDGFTRLGIGYTGEDLTLLDSPEYQEHKVLTNLIGE